MNLLHFDYRMKIEYSEPVENCRFTIKCIPQDNARQKISNLKTEVLPSCNISHGKDGFGNAQIYGAIAEPHDYMEFHAEGDAKIQQILYEEKADDSKVAIFRHSYGLNRPGESLKAYFASLNPSGMEKDYDKAVFLMNRLHRDFSYEKGCTDLNTGAEEAWKIGKGVCQDYAHIFIALCHMAGIPARYVTGLLIGEGASHAWAEILWKNKWLGMDPTNNLLVADSHVKIGCGRDASDCQLNRGIVKGLAAQTQIVSVSVQKI